MDGLCPARLKVNLSSPQNPSPPGSGIIPGDQVMKSQEFQVEGSAELRLQHWSLLGAFGTTFLPFPISLPDHHLEDIPHLPNTVTTAGNRVKMDKIQSKLTEELLWVYLCFSPTDLHLEITLILKAALKIPSLCYSTQHNIIQIKIYFTSYCKQQQEGRAGCGEQLEP